MKEKIELKNSFQKKKRTKTKENNLMSKENGVWFDIKSKLKILNIGKS